MLANLRAGLTRNKKTLAIVGALAVAGIAFVARKKAAASSSTTNSTATTSTTSTGTPAGASTSPYTTYAPYDSTASDVAGALQQQTETLQQLLNTIPTPDPNAVATPATTSAVTPLATTPATTTPGVAAAVVAPLVNMGLVKNPNSSTIYERRSDNSLRAISYDEWSKAGLPGFNVVAASDPLWTSAKYV